MGRQGKRSLLGAGKGQDLNPGDHFLGEHLNICPGMAPGTRPLCGQMAVSPPLSCSAVI